MIESKGPQCSNSNAWRDVRGWMDGREKFIFARDSPVYYHKFLNVSVHLCNDLPAVERVMVSKVLLVSLNHLSYLPGRI